MRAALMGFDVPDPRGCLCRVVLVVEWAGEVPGGAGRSQKRNKVVAGCRMV